MTSFIQFHQAHMLEERVSSAATSNPTSFYQPNLPLYPKWDADRFVRNAYMAQTYVFSAVDKSAQALARCSFRVGPDPDDPTTFSKNAPLAQLLGKGGSPAPGWSTRMWWKYVFAQYRIMGKFACLIERAGGPNDRTGRIVALWPLQAQYIYPIPWDQKDRNPKGYWKGYQYGTKGHPAYREFRTDEVMYCYEPSPDDPRQPLSAIEAAQLDISIAQLINEYDYGLLKNNAVPSTIVAHEAFTDPDMRRAFRRQFMDKFGGPKNAGKTMFLEAAPDRDENGRTTNNIAGKLHVERLGMNPQEMQSPEKRVATINDICVAFKTPLSILGDSTRSKFTNMESDYRNWWNDALIPMAEMVCDLIEEELRPYFPGNNKIWFDFSQVGALKEAPRMSAGDITALHDAKILDRDEARRELGLAPWDDIEHPVEEVPAPISPPTPTQPPEGQPPEISGPAAPLPNTNIPRGVTKALVGTVRRSLNQQKQAIEQRANGRRSKADAPLTEIFDRDFWIRRTHDDLEPVFEALSEYRSFPSAFAGRVAQEITVDTYNRLRDSGSVSIAYDDLEARSEAIAQTVVRMLDEIPADHLVVLLDGISRGKISPAQALELVK